MAILMQTKRRPCFWVTLAVALAVSAVAIHFNGNSKRINDDEFLTTKSCSSFAAGRLATVDGSVMAGHTLDGPFDFRLTKIPGQEHESGDRVHIDYPGIEGGWKHTIRGETRIPEVPKTYAYFNADCPMANEYQVFFGENTCLTRKELRTVSADEALLDWTQVAKLALQRGRTAREAIKAAGALIERFGLEGDGESFLVVDPHEAWCFEIPGFTNEWVAERIPDGHVCPHANRMRIGEIDLDDPDNFLASPNIIITAQRKGIYDPARDGAFHFAKVYNDEKNMKDMANRRREWRMLSLLCPSKEWDSEAFLYPFSVKPDQKISPKWWLDRVWRDQLEGTPFDITKGIAAGPFGSPGRPQLSDVKFERTICIGEMTYSWVSQSRSWLPGSVGGVFWFGMDSPRSNCYTPFYVGVSKTPESYQRGDYTRLSDGSAFWAYQLLDSFSLIRFSQIHQEIRSIFDPIEDHEFIDQQKIEMKAVELYRQNPRLAEEYLTQYSLECATKALNAAKDMFYAMVARYRDGYPATTVSREWKELLNNKSISSNK